MIGEFFPQSGLVGLWHLNGNANDSSGQGNNGTATSVTFSKTNGKFNEGGNFSNASGSKIDVGDVGVLEFSGDFSVICWFNRVSNATTNLRILSKGAEFSTDAGFAIWASDTQVVGAISNGTTRTISNAVNHLGTGVWQMVALVRSGSNQILYLNGVAKDTITAASGSTAGTSIFSIGSSRGVGLYWEGKIDEAAIFSKALSASEIRKWYAWATGKLL